MVADAALTTFGASTLVVYVMQQIKKSNSPMVQEGKAIINRLVSIGGACVAQAGISWTWVPSSHTLALSGLTLSAICFATWHIFCQFSMQEVIYQGTINKPVAPSLAQQVVLEDKHAQTVSVTPNQAAK